MQISDHAAASTHSCTGTVYKHSWKHISILSFRPLQQTSIPHMEKHIRYMATVPVISFQFSPYYCAILENNDMTEPFP